MTPPTPEVQKRRALDEYVSLIEAEREHRPSEALLVGEINRLRAEVAAYAQAVRDGDGPFCQDVCLVECVGVCGVVLT